MKSQIDIRAAIAKRLKAAREHAGYPTIEAFCKKYEFSEKEYTAYENASTAIIASHAMKYCAALNMSLYYLMIGSELKELKEWRENHRKLKKATSTTKTTSTTATTKKKTKKPS